MMPAVEKKTIFVSEKAPDSAAKNYWLQAVVCCGVFKYQSITQSKLPELKQLKWSKLCSEMATMHKESGAQGFRQWMEQVLENKEAEILSGEPDGEALRDAFTAMLPDDIRKAREVRKLPEIGKRKAPGKRRFITELDEDEEDEEGEEDEQPRNQGQHKYVDKGVQTYARGDFDILSVQDMQTPRAKKQKVIDFTTSQPIVIDSREAAQTSQRTKDSAEIARLRVVCPPLTDCEGVYELQKGEVNHQPWWKSKPNNGVQWKMYSSPNGMWTITKGPDEDFRTGRGLVAAGTHHNNKMPHVNDDHLWQCAEFGCWRAHQGIRVISLNVKGAIVKVIERFGNNGVLKKRAFGRLLRHYTNDPYMTALSDETWARFCDELKCAPEKGIPEDVVCDFLFRGSQESLVNPTPTSSASQGVISAQTSQNEQAQAAPVQTNSAVQAKTAAPAQVSRGFAPRCGVCSSCRNPRWKKSCENPPRRAVQQTPSTAGTEPITQFSDDIESDDAVARLLGMRILSGPAPSNPPPRPNRTGYAFGVPLARNN